nr:hypothetical protein [Tanacetum cinerariifolium]
MKRMPLSDVLHMQTIFRNPKEVKPYNVSSPERCNLPASAIRASSDSLVIVDMVARRRVYRVVFTVGLCGLPVPCPFLFQHAKATSNSSGGSFMRMFKGSSVSSSDEWQYPQALAYPAPGLRNSSIVSITYDNEIITGGHVDNSVRLISSDGAKTLEIAQGHSAPVTCMSLSPDSNYLVTGSRDTMVLVWRIHQSGAPQRNNISEPPVNSGTQTSTKTNTTNNLQDKNRKRRIEGPVQVIRGHFGEVICCCVDSDLGVVASCSDSSDVLLHSVSRGRLIRRLDGVKAQMVCLSPNGIVISWNKLLCTLSTHTLNGLMISKVHLPLSCSVCCMEVSSDGQSLLIGFNSNGVSRIRSKKKETEDVDAELNEDVDIERLDIRFPSICFLDLHSLKVSSDGQSLLIGLNSNGVSRIRSKKKETEDVDAELNEDVDIERLDIPSPSICFLDLHSLKVFHILELKEGQDITTLAMNKDNTNLLVSTADKQLIVFTDPALSLKVVDQMLKLGWEAPGLRNSSIVSITYDNEIITDLGVVASCSDSSDVLLHSVSRGRLIRRLDGVKAQMVCLSPNGIVISWNKLLCTLSTHTLNGLMISKVHLPLSCSVCCMEVSSDGQSLLIGFNSNGVSRIRSKKKETEDVDAELNEDVDIERLDIRFPSICFLDLHSLK